MMLVNRAMKLMQSLARERPGMAADRINGGEEVANGRVDCWSGLERACNTSQVVQHRPEARTEIRRVICIRMGFFFNRG